MKQQGKAECREDNECSAEHSEWLLSKDDALQAALYVNFSTPHKHAKNNLFCPLKAQQYFKVIGR